VRGLLLLAAQGFGLGRLPKAPGTFGTLLGLVWLALLLAFGKLWVLLVGLLAGLAVSVWLCGRAEKILQIQDPPSVVLDEIAALPICFLPALLSQWHSTGRLPSPAELLTLKGACFAAVLFGLFRLFDIWKPWPIRGSQRLPGGWGVTVDDVLAALYVALLTVPVVG
jgi:phosphatidylglycerophosphatase A